MKSAKECVTTHLPNGLAPKMDGAAAGNRDPIASEAQVALACRRTSALWKRPCDSVAQAVRCADLGGSSNYSNANFED